MIEHQFLPMKNIRSALGSEENRHLYDSGDGYYMKLPSPT